MFKDKKILGVIPARGGSKGIVGKNLRNIAGKTLLAWTIEKAKKSKLIDRLILSSEDPEIIKAAVGSGCEVPFIRPKELSKDDTPGVDPAIHAIHEICGFDYLVLLQVTSPLRMVDDIDECIKFCIEKNGLSCVSVCEAEKPPVWMYRINSKSQIEPFFEHDTTLRRQDFPKTYVLNGAIFMAQCDWLMSRKTFIAKDTLAFVMPRARSLDIDAELDLEIADLLLSKRIFQEKD